MPRKLLLLVPMLAATFGACSPAEPPLLIDGGQTPATSVGQADPPGEPPRKSGVNEAPPAEDRPARN